MLAKKNTSETEAEFLWKYTLYTWYMSSSVPVDLRSLEDLTSDGCHFSSRVNPQVIKPLAAPYIIGITIGINIGIPSGKLT